MEDFYGAIHPLKKEKTEKFRDDPSSATPKKPSPPNAKPKVQYSSVSSSLSTSDSPPSPPARSTSPRPISGKLARVLERLEGALLYL